MQKQKLEYCLATAFVMIDMRLLADTHVHIIGDAQPEQHRHEDWTFVGVNNFGW